jgi:flagellar hook-associated protein 2
MKVDRIKQERQLVEWRKEAYREVTNLLRAFQNEFFDVLKTNTYMLSSGSYRAFSATSTNEAYVTATATAGAREGSIVIAGIDRLATSTIIKSSQGLPEGKTLDTTLENLGFAEEGTYVKFEVNGVEFKFSSTSTLRQVMNQVSSNSQAGVDLYYSTIEGRFILQTKATGEATRNIAINDVEGSLLENLGIVGQDALKIDGTDALVRFQALGSTQTIEVTRSTNTFTIDGVTYSLKAKTPDGMQPITVSVSQDVDRAYNAIKNFVDRYNQLIDRINGILNEERFRDYLPLTDAQRQEMSDKEIELWEQKAKSGLLRGDSILQNIVNSMRRALSDAVEGVGINLSSIGITTGLYFERGKLHIDENKLKEALRSDTDQVMALFISRSGIAYSPNLDSASRTQRYQESGLMYRISDILMDNIRTTRDASGRKGVLLQKAGIVGDITEYQNMMDQELRRIDKRIDTAMEMLVRQENRYWAQFTALERAIQQMNAQSMWLMQQLGIYQ